MLKGKGFRNYSLHAGNTFDIDTMPAFLDSMPVLRIALLHLDMDVQEPTAFALERLYDRVVPNGLIVIDDYNAGAGATQPVDEFLSRIEDPGRRPQLCKLGFYGVPTYLRKP
jgi:hypothetical protein